ncbi:hypothetical protein OL548_27850 [Lysinibacillus sp. MHQ-1]|nr:hypothetical protein OL548_27850 [Lysinibacillus sp. MHQ-1]
MPAVYEPVTFKQLLQDIDQFDAVFIADEEDAKAEKRTRFADKLKLVHEKKININPYYIWSRGWHFS